MQLAENQPQRQVQERLLEDIVMERRNNMTILDQLADHARERVAYAKGNVSADDMRKRALELGREGRLGSFAFEKALKKSGISFICECKKASPSKGLIAPEFPYLKIAKEYEAAGADCISVLTEPKWFLGSDA